MITGTPGLRATSYGRDTRSALTNGTEERRAPHLDDAPDGTRATTPWTTLAGAIVDAKSIVAARPMPIRDGGSEHRLNGINQRLCTRTRDPVRRHERRRTSFRGQACQMKRLADVDVAET